LVSPIDSPRGKLKARLVLKYEIKGKEEKMFERFKRFLRFVKFERFKKFNKFKKFVVKFQHSFKMIKI